MLVLLSLSSPQSCNSIVIVVSPLMLYLLLLLLLLSVLLYFVVVFTGHDLMSQGESKGLPELMCLVYWLSLNLLLFVALVNFRIPLKIYVLLAFLTVSTIGLSNTSLGYLNYPTQVRTMCVCVCVCVCVTCVCLCVSVFACMCVCLCVSRCMCVRESIWSSSVLKEKVGMTRFNHLNLPWNIYEHL